jgi:hypothetical protein
MMQLECDTVNLEATPGIPGPRPEFMRRADAAPDNPAPWLRP